MSQREGRQDAAGMASWRSKAWSELARSRPLTRAFNEIGLCQPTRGHVTRMPGLTTLTSSLSAASAAATGNWIPPVACSTMSEGVSIS
jgi:hypothetical protein